MSMKLCVRLAFMLSLAIVLIGQSSGSFWRPTLPSDPKDSYYKKFQQVPPAKITAEKLMNNFLHVPSKNGKRQFVTKEDIVIVMDGSGSIGLCQFKYGTLALKNMMEKGFNRAKYDTTFAAVTYGSSAYVNFKFTPYSTALGDTLTNITYPHGGTNTQAGLVEAIKLFDDPRSGHRITARRSVFLLTDGHSNIEKHLTIPKAKALKYRGTLIYVVAIGNRISGIDEMVNIASNPPEYFLFRVNNSKGFWEVIKLVLSKASPGTPASPDLPCT